MRRPGEEGGKPRKEDKGKQTGKLWRVVMEAG